MGLLRLANDESKRIYLLDSKDEPTEEYIEVRKDISKRKFNAIALSMPQIAVNADGTPGSVTLQQGVELQQMLFEELVTGWSLDVPATIDNYLLLSREAGNAVDTAVSTHFSALTPNREEATKSEGPSAANAGGAEQPNSEG
jgi:hypothetical protein